MKRILFAAVLLTVGACDELSGPDVPTVEIDVSPAVVTGTQNVQFTVRNTDDEAVFIDACRYELVHVQTSAAVTMLPCPAVVPPAFTELGAGGSTSGSFKMETRFPRGVYRVRITLLKGPTPSEELAKRSSPAFELQ